MHFYTFSLHLEIDPFLSPVEWCYLCCKVDMFARMQDNFRALHIKVRRSAWSQYQTSWLHSHDHADLLTLMCRFLKLSCILADMSNSPHSVLQVNFASTAMAGFSHGQSQTNDGHSPNL